MIDPAFRNINRSFGVSLKIGDDNLTTNFLGKYYMVLVEIKDFSSTVVNKHCLIK